jgi:hypothetical protein
MKWRRSRISSEFVQFFPTSRHSTIALYSCRLRLKCDDTRAETRFRLSAKRTSPLKSAGASVQSTTGSRVVHISGSNAGYTMFRGSVRILATHSIRQFSLHFPSRSSPCAITFQLDSITDSLDQAAHHHISAFKMAFNR